MRRTWGHHFWELWKRKQCFIYLVLWKERIVSICVMTTPPVPFGIFVFLAVENSSKGDLVTDWLTDWLTFDFCVYNDYKDYSDYNYYNDYRDRDLDLNLDLGRFNDTVQCAGRPFETKYMSQYIDSGQKNRFDVRIQNLFQKLKIPSGKTGFMTVFCFFFPDFFLVAWPFFTNLHEILASGPKLIFQTTLFYKKN